MHSTCGTAVLLLLFQVASTSADFQPDERDPEVELVLSESDYTLKMWPHKFKAVSTAGDAVWVDCRPLDDVSSHCSTRCGHTNSRQ